MRSHRLVPCKTGHKRPKNSGNIREGYNPKRIRHAHDKPARSPSPPSSGQLSAELSDSVVSEEDVNNESSVLDNLLAALSTGSESLANVYKRRQREEDGRSDSGEDEDDGSGPVNVSEEDDSEEGLEYEFSRRQAEGNELKEYRPVDIVEQSEEAESDDDVEVSDSDNELDVENNGNSIVDESAESKSSFEVHLGHTLTNEVVDDLLKRTWKFSWEMPSVDSSMSKWEGTGKSFLKEAASEPHYGLKPKLYEHWLNIYKTSGCSDFHSSRQRHFFSLCNTYRDIMHCNKRPFYLKGLEEDSSMMDAYIMHALNHVYRTRDLVTKNDTKLSKHQDIKKDEMLHGSGFLDQGFTRPKVLFLLPLRSIALRVVKRLIQLSPLSHKANVEHIDRFSKEFGNGDVQDEEDKNDLSDNAQDVENSRSQKSTKPLDFQILFGGNNDDHFMTGIKYTRGSIKLFSDFYSSDIIVASPLGLITKIADAECEKEKDVDYLSSIEVLIIDHADVIAMQNWAHLKSVVEQLNHTPSKKLGTNVMRVRQWYLDGHARFYRQTILLGSSLNPDMNAVFNRLCVNYEGKVKLVSDYKGVLPKVLLPVRQVYERFHAPSITESDDARLDYFSKKVFPKIKDSIQGGTMIFTSSYFEFVRIRNFLKSQNASFCLLGEYTKQSDISRARVWFFQGKRKIMLYTERAHFYHRYKIRGIQNLIIYSLPERKEFYPEVINMLDGSKNMTCNVLFSRFDKLRLERIVGTSAAERMLSSEKEIFVFC